MGRAECLGRTGELVPEALDVIQAIAEDDTFLPEMAFHRTEQESPRSLLPSSFRVVHLVDPQRLIVDENTRHL